MMPPPRRRETDQSFTAKMKDWGGIIASVSAVLSLVVLMFVSLGGQYVLPNDRTARLETRVDRNDARLDSLEIRMAGAGTKILDSITIMNRSIQTRLDLLTISKCIEATVRPPRLRAVCDTLSESLPLRP